MEQCPNCGAAATENFCPQCGQKTRVALPTLPELLHDGLGAVFSYDGKLWRTLRVLVTQPGQLTVDYLHGKRVCYLNPVQLFVWLQAITWIAHRLWFSPTQTDEKSRGILILGVVFWLLLSVSFIPKKLPIVQHLITTAHLWSFLMLWLLAEYSLSPLIAGWLIRLGVLGQGAMIGLFVTYTTLALMLFYTIMALRKVYSESWIRATARTLILMAICVAGDLTITRVLR